MAKIASIQKDLAQENEEQILTWKPTVKDIIEARDTDGKW